jgi:hypothetical protein
METADMPDPETTNDTQRQTLQAVAGSATPADLSILEAAEWWIDRAEPPALSN